MKYLFSIVLVLVSLYGKAQKPDSLSRIKTGFICQFTYNFNIPGADLAKRYGNGSSVGAGVYYKMGSNWFIGIEGTYMFGARLRETGIFDNVVDSNGYAVDMNGALVPVNAQQRGFTMGGKVGKVFPVGRRNRNSGIMASVGLGYMEHYLRLANATGSIAAFQGDLKYGYDRLCAGWMSNQFVGWQNLDKRNRINFFIGFELAQGYTISKRKVDYDKMAGNTNKRLDLYYGFRFAWLLPIYTGVAAEGDGYSFR